MSRKPNVRAKNGHWYSEAGGRSRYFGRVDTVSKTQATARLWTELGDMELGVGGAGGREASPLAGRKELTRGEPASGVNSFLPNPPKAIPQPNPQPISTIIVDELRTRYLDWLLRYRSPASHREAARHLGRFAEGVGDRDATEIGGTDLESFQAALVADGHALDYVKKHVVSVRAMFARGVRMGWLPPGTKPFATVEGIRLAPKVLLEDDLPTDAEVRALLAHAKGDMVDIIAAYHATGARTHELIQATVGDFQPMNKTLVLGKHKRSHTLRDPVPRTITLNPTADAIVRRRCENRNADDPVFPSRVGKTYTSVLLADKFVRVRLRAGVRPTITIYSFRYLWISESLMVGLDALLVAKMAGTSVKMIETVYGHFKTASYQDAQAKLDATRAMRK